MRQSKQLVAVAISLMRDPNRHVYGYELGKESGVRSGVLYPMLTRLLEAGWLSDGWEDQREVHGRPPRRYYELTDAGRMELGAVIARAENTKFAPTSGLGFAQ
ncbi:PadR family transcriptional regulator [Pseudonocardia spinosispora]|uniref:PadR family transcriptional regulator n=1 Tax=Pseudonocardia spinosispora TaxID=103441 RepID=UPI000406CB12|nr:helix-turn-helix transcriptional regulator [Pseudonocardia spinosispora]